MFDARDIDSALERLDQVLPRTNPEILASLRPPAAESDLDELRRCIAPYEIPQELETVLRWHDGQPRGEGVASLLPLSEGPFLGARDAAESYRFLTEKVEPWQWCPLWVPILQDRWSQTGVEIATDGPGVIVDAYFGDTEMTIESSSLAALLHATADIAEAGFLADPPYRERQRLIAARADEAGWSNWPYERTLPNDEIASHWPARWRRASGFDASGT